MGGGGGASPQIPELNTRDVQPWYNFQGQQFGQYVQNQPLLQHAQAGALSSADQVLGANNPYTALFNNQLSQTISSGGRLSAQELRNVDQSTLTGGGGSFGGGSAGSSWSDANSLGTKGQELLNRDTATQQRLNTALGQAGQIQGIQSGALNQLTGVQGAETGTFTQLMNPILQIPLANEQARIAQAQIMEQSQQASSSKSAGGFSSIASVAGAALGAVAMFSDEKLKENIKDTGLKSRSGIPLKTFNYIGDDKKILGALSKDIKKVHPDAVHKDLMTGFEFIDLNKTDIPVAQVA